MHFYKVNENVSRVNKQEKNHSTRFLLLRLNNLEMEDFLLLLAFFSPIQQKRSIKKEGN